MSRPAVRLPIGISDFRELREGGFYYVDETALIDDVLREPAKVLLVPLFDGLAIASSEAAKAHSQRHPVIFATFKDIKPTSWEHCFEGISGVLAGLDLEPPVAHPGDLLSRGKGGRG